MFSCIKFEKIVPFFKYVFGKNKLYTVDNSVPRSVIFDKNIRQKIHPQLIKIDVHIPIEEKDDEEEEMFGWFVVLDGEDMV